MNCLEFRRLKLADPRRLPPQADAHRNACAPCTDFARDVDQAQARLAEVLAVPVPEGLAERVILQRKSGRRFAPRLLALAATLLLAAGVGYVQWQETPRHDYARYALEHVLDEPEAFTTHVAIDPERFAQVVADFGGELSAPLGRVRYMRLCPTPQGSGWHVVLDTPHGTATLILIPDAKHGSRTLSAALQGLNAKARRAGEGYYALVADSPRALDEVDEMVKRNVRWRG